MQPRHKLFNKDASAGAAQMAEACSIALYKCTFVKHLALQWTELRCIWHTCADEFVLTCSNAAAHAS